MKRILIWDYNIPLKNTGGPSGYLFNIHEYLVKNKDITNISFLSEQLTDEIAKEDQSISNKSKFRNILVHSIPAKIRNIPTVLRELKQWKQNTLPTLKPTISYQDYDIIHFHHVKDLFQYGESLRKNGFEGKIILTSHSPQPYAEERFDNLTLWHWVKSKAIRRLGTLEYNSWREADFIMFPVEDATEVYQSNPYIKDYLKINADRLIFCPTGIESATKCDDKLNIRQKLGIPPNAFVVSFIGRHNEIKGYSKLKIIGEKILNLNNDIYFVIAGEESPLKGLNHPRWIELGWIDYSKVLLEQSDLFVLPNEKTYFDLIAIECLRAGTPILMTKTGGNKYFMELEDNQGVFYFDFNSPNDAVTTILKMYEEKIKMSLLRYRDSNKNLFNKNFTTEIFINNYISLCNQL